jgi:5-methylcytosine-specific restriction endonuclease McrA
MSAGMAQYRHRRITGPRWQRIVAMIVTRDHGICWLCGGAGATSADHVIPLADGGSNYPSNLRTAHRHCNYAKNARRSSELRDRAPHTTPSRVWPGAIDLSAP